MNFHGDQLRVVRRVPLQGSFDLALDRAHAHRRLDGDLVADPGHAEEVSDAVRCRLLLVLPADVAAERDEAALHHHLDGSIGHRGRPQQSAFDRECDIGIGAIAEPGQPDLELDGESVHAGYALRRAFGMPFLGIAAHMARKSHHACSDFDADLRRRDAGFPLQLGDDVLLQLAV